MSTIINFIQEEEVRKRDGLLIRCRKGVEAGILELDVLSATIFVKTLFDTGLVASKSIVDAVKSGTSIYDAYYFTVQD